jgi:hypothetical protein
VERAWYATAGAAHLRVRSFSEAGFPDDVVIEVRRQPFVALPFVALVAPATRKRVFFRSGEQRGFTELIGVDPAAEAAIRGYRLEGGQFLVADQPGVVLRASWAHEQHLGVGDSLELITRDGFRSFAVVGLLGDDRSGLAS